MSSSPPGAEHTPVADLGYARVDLDRARRTGDPEVVYGAGKTPAQTVGIVTALRAHTPDRPALVTRAAPDVVAALQASFGEVHVDPDCPGLVRIGALPAPRGQVLVVSAGTSDAAVAAEAAGTANAFGTSAQRLDDVGVAGVHRLLAEQHRLEQADCLVVVAGMEGALPSVVGGLVGVPVVAVPTSAGYGTSFGGVTALLAMLSSCAPGIAVVGIDNGFGAGVHAARVARRAAVRS